MTSSEQIFNPGPTSLRELFRVNSKLALRGFGGVLPWAQRTYVEELKWLEQREFTELLAMAQVSPGPNVVNLSIALGDRYFGWRGALVSLAGILTFPMLIILLLAWSYSLGAQSRWYRGALAGMSPVAAGLILAMAVKMVVGQFKAPRNSVHISLCLVFAGLTFLSSTLLKWPITTIVVVLAPFCIVFYWLSLRREKPR
jgi:chromate transporter